MVAWFEEGKGGGEVCMSMSIRVEHEVVRGKHMAVDIESNRIL